MEGSKAKGLGAKQATGARWRVRIDAPACCGEFWVSQAALGLSSCL